MSNRLKDWLLCKEYSLDEVTKLLIGCDPYESLFDPLLDVEDYNYLEAKMALYERLILEEAEAGRLGKKVLSKEHPDEGCFSFGQEEIIEWATNSGLEFPYGFSHEPTQKSKTNSPLDELLDPNNPYLSDKLRVIIDVWLELVEKGTQGQTPKQAAERIIKDKYPATTDVKELVKVINWYPQGRKDFPPLKEYKK
ncbi:hypothetical protein [uncultured Endozoicomonas sp.]|uniref:hypothetical protein n=1 Tax=uncultured Endozoicomonas sp. TaxID=432652 RepID=UPI0026298413|nr:hypothetical protein [uncultured Endozoicomonas sp.]